jgi:hypothetical protein
MQVGDDAQFAEERDISRIVVRDASLIAYRVSDWPTMRIVPAARARGWMDDSQNRFAYRCLPLLIANQSGWWILNSQPIRAWWTGGWDPSCVRVECLDGADRCPASGHFGEGVLTFTLPFLFRTPPGFNLHVRGPANLPKDGIQPLEGVVETDWSMATFTMNWKLTRPNVPIEFEKDEPICMVAPQPRGILESFVAKERDVRADADVFRAYMQWSHSRSDFLKASRWPDSEAAKEGWQKHYFRGVDLEGARAREHQSKLDLREFEVEQSEIKPAEYPPLPQVRVHQEALDALKNLGSGHIGVEEAFVFLTGVIRPYLPYYPAGAHGSMVGALLCRALFPHVARQVPPEALQQQWDKLRGLPYDGIAMEAAIGTFAIACAVASDDARLQSARHKLWEQKLKAVLPPPEGMEEP